jgi:hypothetical protein
VPAAPAGDIKRRTKRRREKQKTTKKSVLRRELNPEQFAMRFQNSRQITTAPNACGFRWISDLFSYLYRAETDTVTPSSSSNIYVTKPFLEKDTVTKIETEYLKIETGNDENGEFGRKKP